MRIAFRFLQQAGRLSRQADPHPKSRLLGTHNTLGLDKEKNALFFSGSTSEAYGDPLVNPQNEEYWGNVNPIGPRGVYMSKRFAEP